MRLADKVQEWLDTNGWEDQIDYNEAEQLSQLNIRYGINDQLFDLWIETDEKKDWLNLFLSFPFKVNPSKLKDCIELLNLINRQSFIGGLIVLPDRNIQFHHAIDVENTEPSIEMIQNMLNSGADIINVWFEEIAAVALTRKTVQEVFDELEALSVEEERL